MPNTLAHIALHVPISRGLVNADGWFTWSLLGCIIPDLPWILRRVLEQAPLSVDSYGLFAYATVQSSLFSCILLSAACALVFASRGLAFVTISFGCLAHLCLDALEIKWGNGVHLLAPFSWRHFNWGVVWPDSGLVLAFSLLAIPVFAFFLVSSLPPWRGLVPNARQLAGAALLITAYFAAPFALLSAPIEADNHYLGTLSDLEHREGRYVEFDRVPVSFENGRYLLKVFTGERIDMPRFPGEGPGIYSIRARFLSEESLETLDWHRHAGTRDFYSIAGLILIASWLAYLAMSYLRRYYGNPG